MLSARDAPTLHRFLRRVEGTSHAAQADYVVLLGDGCIHAKAGARSPGAPLDVTPIDGLLLAFRLLDRPRVECEVPPAWRAYQEKREPGSPIAKFVLYIDLRRYDSGTFEREPRTRAGSRNPTSVAAVTRSSPELIEFHCKEDSSAIRVDFWLERQPQVEGRETVFGAALRVHSSPMNVWSFVEPYDVPVPPGEYDVSITVINRGKHSARSLTHDERFNRDDLERYEILFRRLPAARDADGRDGRSAGSKPPGRR